MGIFRYEKSYFFFFILNFCFYRSEDVELYKLTVHKDNNWNVMNELGKLNQLHFIDMNTDVQPYDLKYVKEVQKCDAALKKIE